MNKKQYHSVLRSLTELKAPAASIDLWPALQARIQMSHSNNPKGIIMNKEINQMSRKLKPAFILMIVVLLGAIFFALPPGHTLAQEILHFFTNNETNVMPGTTIEPVIWVEQTPEAAAATITPLAPQSTPAVPAFEEECGAFNNPLCSIDSIRGMVNFPIYALAELPEGLAFTGATGGLDSVVLTYKSPDQQVHMDIWEEPFISSPNQLSWALGADADIQNVQIGDVIGEYTKGSYNGNNNPPLWDSTINLQWLRWVDHGILFTLKLFGASPDLGHDDLAVLAAALTDGPVGANGVPAAETEVPAQEHTAKFHELYPLTLTEAEDLAGLTLMTPSTLPETLTFIGAKIDEATKEVWLFYLYNNRNYPDTSEGLMLREQLKSPAEDCSLCGFIQGEYDPYGPKNLIASDALIEVFQIGEYEGLYVEGIGWVASGDQQGWYWDSEPYRKRIRFQTDELAIEVWVDSYEFTKEDLIDIAKSLK